MRTFVRVGGCERGFECGGEQKRVVSEKRSRLGSHSNELRLGEAINKFFDRVMDSVTMLAAREHRRDARDVARVEQAV